MSVTRSVRVAAGAGAAALALAAGSPGAAAAQATQELDRGTFELQQDGSSVGTETFAVRRERSSVRAVGRIQLTSAGTTWRAGQAWLQTDPDFRPQLFRLEPMPEVEDGETVAAVRQDDRVRVQISSSAGQRSKEFVAPDGFSMLHTDVAHHLYVLLRQHAAALDSEGEVRVPVVLPVRRQRVTLRIRRGAREEITTGGGPRQAVHHVVEGEGVRLEAWTDEEGRILRVHHPESGRTAVRTEEGEG
jgi:hypothetical protein